ncbi:MAG: CRISPR-associated protein Cas4 [Thermoleophilia bacterium]|nr:CRISPR-associated protein Cas4 [Thermoleophilia bacterium]
MSHVFYEEEELLPISGLQHLIFCERQCALIYVEQIWQENRLTVLGKELHRHVHEAASGWRNGLRIARGVPLRSLRLGLVGKADVVEFRIAPTAQIQSDAPGIYEAFPVEYKRGRPKPAKCDEVQICAQAMCLEEMLGIRVDTGAIFYGEPRRRHLVNMTDELRARTTEAARRFHELIKQQTSPPPKYSRKCRACSLAESCMPSRGKQARSALRHIKTMILNTLSHEVWSTEETD